MTEPHTWLTCRAAAQEATNDAAGDVPEPVVKIDNQSDSFATLVTVEYGDRLGELLDTVRVTSCSSLSLLLPHIHPNKRDALVCRLPLLGISD